MSLTYEEAQQLELVRQLELARQAANANAVTTTPGLLPTRRSMLDLSPPTSVPVTGQITGGGIPIRGGAGDMVAPDAFNPRFSGGVVPSSPAQAFQDSRTKIFPDVPVPAAAVPGFTAAQLQSFMRPTGGVGNLGVSSTKFIDDYQKDRAEALKAAEAKKAASDAAVIAAWNAQKPHNTIDLTAERSRLLADNPMVADNNWAGMAAKFLPVFENGQMRFSDALARGNAGVQAALGRQDTMRAARQGDLKDQLALLQHNNDQANKNIDFENARGLGIANVNKFSTELPLLGMQGKDAVAAMRMQAHASDQQARAVAAANKQSPMDMERASIARAIKDRILDPEVGATLIQQSYGPATKEPKPMSAEVAKWADETAQTILRDPKTGKSVADTPKGRELYLKFRMAASLPAAGAAAAAQKALFDDVRNTPW